MAGVLVLLYGQIPTRIVTLTADTVTTSETGTHVALRERPVLVPPPLATLILQLATQTTPTQPASKTTASPAWLFPGARPGTHLSGSHLSTALNNTLGIFIRSARGAALTSLAADLPAPILADLLGLSITTATRWTAVAARDNADYIAACIQIPLN